MKRIQNWFSTIVLLLIALPIQAQEFNAGFVQGLWYADEVLFADEPTRIYVAIRNNTGADLSGTVEFFVDDVRIERRNVAALDGRLIESWSDWTPTYGEHIITAQLSRTELSRVGSSTERVSVVSASAEDTIFVDYDTDGDGIGNKTDKDDDGDGVSDATEISAGTDPLDPDDPKLEEVTDETDDASPASEDSSDSGTEANGSANTAINRTSNEPAGLEQFLSENRADAALTSFTETINTTRERLDDYRSARSQESGGADDVAESRRDSATSSTATTSSSTTTTTTNEDGFGEITRTQSESSPGIMSSITALIKKLVLSTYTLILFLLSLYLSHPVLVQLTLLFLILIIIIKIARRLGSRPQ